MWQILAPLLGSAGMLGFAFVVGESRYLVLAAVIAGAMLLTGIGARVASHRARRCRHTRIAERYRQHLEDRAQTLCEAAAHQRQALEAAHPGPTELLALAPELGRVWERHPDDPDFLSLRIGIGPAPAAVRPSFDPSSDPLAERDPELTAAALRLAETSATVADLPIVVDGRNVPVLTLTGEQRRALGRSLLCQIAYLHAPTDLRIVGLIPPERVAEWEWLKWLPHARQCRAASTVSDEITLSADPDDFSMLLGTTFGAAVAAAEAQDRLHSSPGLSPGVIVVDGYRPDRAPEILDRCITHAARLGLLVLCLVENPAQAPARSAATIDCADLASYVENGSGGRHLQGLDASIMDPEHCLTIARRLAPLRLRTGPHPLPVDEIGLIDLLDPAGDGPPVTLATPVGVAEDGRRLVLDLKEASAGGMGPHGILIGATGSGKSELLRTLVSGLASRSHPEDLALVLADFKGGATFAGLEDIPHTAGMISNLEADLGLVDRMEQALFGEMERRQRLLRRYGFDRADTYRDERRTRPQPGMEPLPALLVVVDEFGELLAARPQFVDLFASIGRTGRSLGVHLLLASQRLDEGRIRTLDGHLRYRICLRTFTPEESIAVLGHRSAHDLPSVPGIGYLRVDGTVCKFKTAQVSRPVRRGRFESESSRRRIRPFAIETPPAVDDPDPAEASTVTEMAVLAAQATGPERARPVWLPPLSEAVRLEDLETGGNGRWLTPVVGLGDDPRGQRQEPRRIDFAGTEGHLAVVGNARTGKSTTLVTTVLSLTLEHSPDDVQIYAIDLGGGSLHRLEPLPHVGAVLGRSDREEITGLIRSLGELVEERAEDFRRHRLAGMADYLEARRAGTVASRWGEVFVVIDNWGSFVSERNPSSLSALEEIIAGGLHYGIHLVIATPRWQDLRLSVRDHMAGRLELAIADPLDSEIDRSAAATIPVGVPGRAIDSSGGLLQLATASDIDGFITRIDHRWARHRPAPAVRSLPALISSADLPEEDGVTLGILEHDLEAWNVDLFGPDPHFLIVGDGGCGKTNLLRLWMKRLCERFSADEVRIALVDYRRQLLGAVRPPHDLGSATMPEEASALTEQLHAALLGRGPVGPPRPRLVVFVDDYDLVAVGSGNPLAGLVDAAARGRDLGFHLVIARRAAGVTRASFEPLWQRLNDLVGPGLVMHGEPTEGPVLRGVRPTEQPIGRGVLVTSRGAVRVQTAMADAPPIPPGPTR